MLTSHLHLAEPHKLPSMDPRSDAAFQELSFCRFNIDSAGQDDGRCACRAAPPPAFPRVEVTNQGIKLWPSLANLLPISSFCSDTAWSLETRHSNTPAPRYLRVAEPGIAQTPPHRSWSHETRGTGGGEFPRGGVRER